MSQGIRISLVSLPFYSAFASCYQLELLAEVLRTHDHAVDTIHANYDFGAMMVRERSLRLYKKLTSVRYFGDYLYLARRSPERAHEILGEMNATIRESRGFSFAQYKTFFRVVQELHDRILARLEVQQPAVVGLSATHYQLVPSLDLARQIKQRLPDAIIVMGGYMSSLKTAHDLLDLHPDIDWIVYGEGEQALLDLVEELRAGRCTPRGVRSGKRGQHLDIVPRYDAFIAAGPARDDHVQHVAFNFELSRGCYWNKCSFCNFNATYGSFRKFDMTAVVAEMDRLHMTYGARRFQFLDTSLPPRFADYLRKEAIERPHYDIFCEVMIDFDGERLLALRRFGVRRVQVGIESFSSAHLNAMVKNSSLVDNIIFLSNCTLADIEPVYGLMVNIPGETPDQLAETCVRMRQLRHLPPPKYVSGFDARPESPVFEDRQAQPFRVTFQHGIFDTVLPAAEHNCEMRPSRVDFGLGHDLVRKRLIHTIECEMHAWRDAWKQGPPRLCVEQDGVEWRVRDERGPAVVLTPVSEIEVALLRRALCTRGRDELRHGLAIGDDKIARMYEAGWLVEDDDGVVLGLVGFPGQMWSRKESAEPLLRLRTLKAADQPRLGQHGGR